MTSKIKFTKQHPRDLDIQSMQREIEDKAVALDKDGNIILDRDIHCRSIYVEGDSLYIGGIKVNLPISSDNTGYWKYVRANKEIQFTNEANPEDHATNHESGGKDEVTLNIVAKTAAYTVTASDDIIICGAGNETFTIDLPIPVSRKVYFIKNMGAGRITVDANATGNTTIDRSNRQILTKHDCLEVAADSSEYHII